LPAAAPNALAVRTDDHTHGRCPGGVPEFDDHAYPGANGDSHRDADRSACNLDPIADADLHRDSAAIADNDPDSYCHVIGNAYTCCSRRSGERRRRPETAR
jgi:hypothetical protein